MKKRYVLHHKDAREGEFEFLSGSQQQIGSLKDCRELRDCIEEETDGEITPKDCTIYEITLRKVE